MTRKRVVIVGGGLAGLAASEAIANSDLPWNVLLLEAKTKTGGRAGSFKDPTGGDPIDYCQHVAMGCCTNLIALLQRCGLGGELSRHQELRFHSLGHSVSRIAASKWLPAPLHLAPAISAMEFLSRRQQNLIRRGLWQLMRTKTTSLADQTAGRWLRQCGQDPQTIADFWDVILVSALGERSEVVSMAAARKVLIDGFAAAREACDVWIPNQPLSELFGRQLVGELRKRGVDIVTECSVSQIVHDGAPKLIASDGTVFRADHVISAVPWHRVANLMCEDTITRRLPDLDKYARWPASSITGLHLWFDRPIMHQPHAVMVGTTAQWLFRRPSVLETTKQQEYYFQVVISGSHQSPSTNGEALESIVVSELQGMFPLARKAQLIRSRTVTDPRSVFSLRPDVEAQRPTARTALPWLHLAGDWIQTGWPATMEGAVIGGRMAASSVMQSEGKAAIEIDAGLPRNWLSRRLIRE